MLQGFWDVCGGCFSFSFLRYGTLFFVLDDEDFRVRAAALKVLVTAGTLKSREKELLSTKLVEKYRLQWPFKAISCADVI